MELLEGYVLASVGGYHLVGRLRAPIPDRRILSPVFELQIEYMFDGQGNFGIQRRALPVMGSSLINEVVLPSEGVIIIPCEMLSKKERETLSVACQRCAKLKEGIKAAELGIVTASAEALKNLPKVEVR